jgi:hypothetical protein
MSDPLEQVMGDVWEWKRRAAEETRGLSDAELIRFYRGSMDRIRREQGLNLPSRPASEEPTPPR